MDLLPIYILIAFVVALVAYFVYKKYRKANVTDPSQVDWSTMPSGSVALSSDSRQVTPKGAIVFSKNGVTSTVLSLVDTGLDGAFADAVSSGIPSDLTIIFMISIYRDTTVFHLL